MRKRFTPSGLSLAAMKSTDEMAKELRIHAETLRRLVKRGRLPAWKAGNRLRFWPDLVSRWSSREIEHQTRCRESWQSGKGVADIAKKPTDWVWKITHQQQDFT